MQYIVRLFPEISIKSKPVRNRLIRLLRQNIINVARARSLCVHIRPQWDKLLVYAEEGQNSGLAGQGELSFAMEAMLSEIPGIHSFLQVSEFPLSTLEDIYGHARPVYEPLIEGHSFAVRVRRRGRHEFSSQQAEREIGELFLKNARGASVNLTSPDVTVRIEIDSQRVFLITGTREGLGGFPVSSQGEALALVSGGFDSGVAAYRAIRRGLRVHYVFFNMGGTAHELGVKQECYYLWHRYASSHRVRFTAIPFDKIVGQILEKTHHGVRGVILKRMMVRVAGEIAKKHGIGAIVTGESIGQVSSQTLVNLGHIDRVSPVMVLRPLIMSDKQEIVDEAAAIGTQDFALVMPEYCGVISDHPNVAPSEGFVEEQEALMDRDLVEQALEGAKASDIRDLPGEAEGLQTQVEVVASPAPGEVVIDIRAPDEARLSPLDMEGVQCLKLPFYKVISSFGELDRLKTYVLYCDQGIMSQMQARQLKEMGHHNVKILRPAGH